MADDRTATDYCSQLDPNSWSPANFLATAYCGVSQVIGAAAPTVEHGQDTFGGIGEDLAEAANPANLAGAGAGVAFGAVAGMAAAVAAAVAVGVVAAGAADLYFTGGAGTRALLGSGRR